MADKREPQELFWELVESRQDRSYKLFSVHINKNKSPRTGQIHEFQVMSSPDWVAVIAVTPDDQGGYGTAIPSRECRIVTRAGRGTGERRANTGAERCGRAAGGNRL